MDSVVTGTRKIFTYGALFTKILVLLLLIVFSYIHADPSFINSHPKLFITESILSGGLIAAPFMWIMHNRGIPWASTIPIGVSAFMIFYLFHVFMEFSGANRESEKATNSSFVKWTTIIVTSSLLVLSLLVHDFTPNFGTILLETGVISLSLSLLEIYKAHNRGHKDYFSRFFKMFGFIVVVNLIFQFGGLYSHISVPKLDEIPVDNFQQ